MSTPEVLRVEGLSRRYGAREVVRDFNMVMKAGDRLALCGPNGSGKTTIIRCLAGTLTPSAGELHILEHTAGSLAARRLIGVSLSQERSFYFRLTGRENLRFFARVRGYGKREAASLVHDVVEELELERFIARRVDEYSTGMNQQLAFARALLGEPPVLLLDEPTRSLDTAAVDRLWSALDRRPGTALLIATHRDDDVARCGARRDLDAPETESR